MVTTQVAFFQSRDRKGAGDKRSAKCLEGALITRGTNWQARFLSDVMHLVFRILASGEDQAVLTLRILGITVSIHSSIVVVVFVYLTPPSSGMPFPCLAILDLPAIIVWYYVMGAMQPFFGSLETALGRNSQVAGFLILGNLQWIFIIWAVNRARNRRSSRGQPFEGHDHDKRHEIGRHDTK